MQLSSYVFYTANVLLLTLYLIIAALVRRPGGISGRATDQTPKQRYLGAGFFLLAAALHADMAWHVATLTPFFKPPRGGPIAWDFALLVLAKFVVAVTALINQAVDNRRHRRGSQ
jgi:hypothetical protein